MSAFVDYMIAWRTRSGLLQQHMETASGMAKGSLSNVEGRKTLNLETFIRLAHGLGKAPSELASLFFDSPYSKSVALRGSVELPIVTERGVSAETIDSAESDSHRAAAIRRSKGTGARGAKAKGARPKKDRDR